LGKRRSYLAWLVVLATFVSTAGVALAEPRVSLDPAPDGTLILVGSGWRPGQRMMISVGRDQFPVLADSVGEFEIQTGMPAIGVPPEPLAVHGPYALMSTASLGLIPRADAPHPLAVLFAQALMTGAMFLGFGIAGIGSVALAARYVRTRRSA
jgi:hypothetical protein